MTIQCPECGFSGRIPSSARGHSHLATCPKCRYQFALRASLLTARLGHGRSSRTPTQADDGESDPSSSSYELPALTWESAAGDDACGAEVRAGAATKIASPISVPAQASLDDRDGITPAAAETSKHDVSTRQPALSACLTFNRDHRMVISWYERLLQIWGVVLLLWAALILGRDLLRTRLSGQGAEGNGDLVSTVISVLILVAGAAGLFLVLEFGRSLRAGVRPSGISSQAPQTAFQHALGARLKESWHRPAHTAQPVRT